MNITIINGTNRDNNKSQKISQEVVHIVNSHGHSASCVDLRNFDTLFDGEYIELDNASKKQKQDIQSIIDADILFFVVPTYHTGIPSPLKNFLDTIKVEEAFQGKIIGVISSNSNNHDHGARQAVQVINGILSYKKLHSFVVPIMPVINFNDIDKDRIERFIAYCEGFKQAGFRAEGVSDLSV